MTHLRVAHRYASAIYDSARDAQKLKETIDDLRSISEAMTGSRELVLFFKSPIVSNELKASTIKELFYEKIGVFTIQMLSFLVDQKREDILPEIISAFFVILRQREGIQLASVSSAIALSSEQQSSLHRALESITKKKVELGFQTDPSIRGGVVVRLDDTVYDGSIRNQLRQLRKKFSQSVLT